MRDASLEGGGQGDISGEERGWTQHIHRGIRVNERADTWAVLAQAFYAGHQGGDPSLTLCAMISLVPD